MPPFVFIDKPSVEDESVRLRKEFATLVDKLDATIKTIPDDRPELMQEKRDWNAQWDALSAAFSACFAAAQKRGLQLSLSTADTTLVKSGNVTYAMHECQFAEKLQDDAEKMDVVLGDAGGGEEDADGEPEVASATVVTSAKRARKAKKPAEADEPRVSKSGARAVVPGAKVDHVLPCGNCKGVTSLAVVRGASTKKAPSATPVAGGSRLSAPGSIRRTVSSPERQILEGKKLAVEDDVGDAEDLEELHEMRQVRAQLMQAYSMIFEATLALDKQEQRILKKRAARK
ncbi:hypothetical protein DEU56DRAFT_920545 [Suillus clintonianus]|uniref:uncharacterized protein n=1 Tax=Suillus clintonianus TaxID=1904413 RepID=UPI001B85C02D|nr:uncharacterized protein DEU56DRAFT_920545 [Suillus clintonianus]KAG2107818.1 hypothetical protein DEU56DRAFT_920545 [Suillus clintonianus]